jgi:hypothetical protein
MDAADEFLRWLKADSDDHQPSMLNTTDVPGVDIYVLYQEGEVLLLDPPPPQAASPAPPLPDVASPAHSETTKVNEMDTGDTTDEMDTNSQNSTHLESNRSS